MPERLIEQFTLLEEWKIWVGPGYFTAAMDHPVAEHTLGPPHR